jgi:hypothetical protein
MSNPTKVSRRLVAVFAADVQGYSRLMGADEVGTLKGLTERRAILDRLIGGPRGPHSEHGRRQRACGVRQRCRRGAMRGDGADCSH